MLAQTGMPAQGVFLATIIGAVAGTLMMAFYANLPYAQAPGMGLNAFFTFTVVFGLGYSWQRGLIIVLIHELKCIRRKSHTLQLAYQYYLKRMIFQLLFERN